MMLTSFGRHYYVQAMRRLASEHINLDMTSVVRKECERQNELKILFR